MEVPFLFYIIFFLRRDYCKKHRFIAFFVKLKIFQHEDNKEQDV